MQGGETSLGFDTSEFLIKREIPDEPPNPTDDYVDLDQHTDYTFPPVVKVLTICNTYIRFFNIHLTKYFLTDFKKGGFTIRPYIFLMFYIITLKFTATLQYLVLYYIIVIIYI